MEGQGIEMKLEGVVAVAWAVVFLLAMFVPALRGPASTPSVLPPELTSGISYPDSDVPPSEGAVAPSVPTLLSSGPLFEPQQVHAVLDVPKERVERAVPPPVAVKPVPKENQTVDVPVPAVPTFIEVPNPPVVPDEPKPIPRLDVCFCLDTTGSMSDEIDVAKQTILEIAAAVKDGEPSPDVRYALVIYRDLGDVYVTRVFDFSNATDLAAILRDVRAENGGDTPESVSEALYRSVHDVTWDMGKVSRGIYLIGDAPPHLDYDNGYDYLSVAKEAASMGIVIDAIGCSGIQGSEKEFKEVANITGGAFVYLTYSSTTAGGGSTGGGCYDGCGGAAPGGCGGAGTGDGSSSGSGTGMGSGEGSGAAGGSAGGGGGSSTGTNDLDTVLTDLIKDQASAAGVTYGDGSASGAEAGG
jgi:hypothetical protein